MQLIFCSADLKPLIDAAVAQILDRFGPGDRLAYPKPEAAQLLGVKSHVLRDARLCGEITGAKLGRGYAYTRADLLAFIERRKTEPHP